MNSKYKLPSVLFLCVLYGVAVFEGFLIATNRNEIKDLKLQSAHRIVRAPKLVTKQDTSPATPDSQSAAVAPSGKNSLRSSDSMKFLERAIRGEAFQANLVNVMAGHLTRRYGELFKLLRLDSNQERQLKKLLMQGLFSPELIPSATTLKQATLEEAQAYYVDFESKIQRLLGEQKYRLYRNYKQELPVANTVEDIAVTLASSGNPLDDPKRALLLATLKNKAPKAEGSTFVSVDAVRAAATGSERAAITMDFLEASKGWLTRAQYDTLVTMSNQESVIQRAQALKDSLKLPLQLPVASVD